MNMKFKSFTCVYPDDIDNMINQWLSKQENPIDIINWRCSGGDERTTVIIWYYDYSEVTNDSV